MKSIIAALKSSISSGPLESFVAAITMRPPVVARPALTHLLLSSAALFMVADATYAQLLPPGGGELPPQSIVQTPEGRGVAQGGAYYASVPRIEQTAQGRSIVETAPNAYAIPGTYPSGYVGSTGQNVIRIGPAGSDAGGGATLDAAAGTYLASGLTLLPNAPDTYTVQRGDTLWSIASRYLSSPGQWPRLWRMGNDEVRLPQRLVPGTLLVLDRNAPGGPRLAVANDVGMVTASLARTSVRTYANRLEPKVYVDANAQEAIPTIPQSVIEPFLSRPFLVNPARIKGLPTVIAARGDRVSVGPGDIVYAKGVNPQVKQWQIVRPDKPLPDPDRPGSSLGLVVNYIGPATLLQAGDPATLRIGAAQQETIAGDLLVPAVTREIIAYVPHTPTTAINARVINMLNGVGEGGQYSVVAISRGAADGLERGHVLSLYRNEEKRVRNFDTGKASQVRLPPTEYGTLFVFRLFEHAAYALVMHTSLPVYPGDLARAP